MDEAHRRNGSPVSSASTNGVHANGEAAPASAPARRRARPARAKSGDKAQPPHPKAAQAKAQAGARVAAARGSAQSLPILPGRAQPAKKDDVTPLCAKCAALCCRYVALPIDNPDTAAEYDNIRWYLMHENIHVFVEDGQWYIGFAARCKHLQADNLCGIYETRPRVCRGYDTDNCEWHGGEYKYEHLFTSAEQLRRHAEEELGRSILFKPRPRPKKPKLRRGKNGTKRVELPVA